MSAEFWGLMVTIAKIGLPAIIAGLIGYTIARLQHRQAVEQAAVRRRLELIEEITAGVAEFGNLVARYSQVAETIYHAHYQDDSTVGEIPQALFHESADLRQQLKSGSALEKSEGLVYLIAADDGTLPTALSDLRRLAVEVMYAADGSIEHFDIETLERKLGEFKKHAAYLMVELRKAYRNPAN